MADVTLDGGLPAGNSAVSSGQGQAYYDTTYNSTKPILSTRFFDGTTRMYQTSAVLFYAADIGLKGDDSTDNLATFNSWYATAPTGAVLVFEPGTYRFSGTVTLNRDIQLTFRGTNKGSCLLKTTSATVDLFSITVAAFYYRWEYLGFRSSVTRTAGSYISATNNNALLDLFECEFQGYFNGVSLTGSTAGNIGVINSCQWNTPAAGGSGLVINGSTINIAIANSTINSTGVSSIGIQINQSGSVQIDCCDIIGGLNALLVNATGVVSAILCTNVFFDQATLGATVKFQGTSAISRVKFIACGITCGVVGNPTVNACEITGTGTGTSIPDAIDFIACDFYNNGNTSTTNGILVNGCRSVAFLRCRIAGFTNGIQATPYNSNGITAVSITDCLIGATENFSGNGTGILLNAGAVQYGLLKIHGCEFSGNTTANITDNATSNVAKLYDNNSGLGVPPAPLTTTPATISTTETVVHQISLPANSLLVGSTYRVTAFVTITGTTPTVLARLRIGTAGTTADTQVCATAAATCTSGSGVLILGFVTIRSVGSGGTALGNVTTQGTALATSDQNSAQTATVTVNTTVANFAELTLIGGGTAPVITVVNAFWEVVNQA